MISSDAVPLVLLISLTLGDKQDRNLKLNLSPGGLKTTGSLQPLRGLLVKEQTEAEMEGDLDSGEKEKRSLL